MFVKFLVLLNLVLAASGLYFGIEISKNFDDRVVNIPKLKVNFHKYEFQEESLKLTFRKPRAYRKNKTKKKIANIKTVKKEDFKSKQAVGFIEPVLKNINIEINEASRNTVEKIDIDLGNKIYKDQKKFINNSELVLNIKINPVTIQKENWVAFLESKNIEKSLIALGEYYPSNNDVLANKKSEEVQVDKKEIEDKANLRMAANKKLSDDELVFFEYAKPNDEAANIKLASKSEKINNPTNIKDQKEESIVDQNFVPANVAKVIERELTSQDSLSLAHSAPVKRDERVDPKPEPLPPAPQMNTSVLKAIEVNMNNGDIEAINSFNFIPDYDQNMVYESDNYEASLALDFNTRNDYSVVRGRVDSQGMLMTRVELPLLTSHHQLEVPLFNQRNFFDYLETKDIQGYGGYLLVDLDDTEIIDVDLISVNSKKNENYEARIFLDENFKETKIDNKFRYVLFLDVTPGVVLVRYLNDNGAEMQKPTFILPDEMVYDPTKTHEYSSEKVVLMERGSLANSNIALDIDNDNIVDFYSGISPDRESINEFYINRDFVFSGYRKYLELNHLESPVIVGYGNDSTLEVPALDYIEKIMDEMDITLERECLIQLNLNKGITDIRLYGEAINGPLSYETKYLGSDGYFTDDINGMSEKLFMVGMEPGIVSLKVEYSDKTSEYFQTYCSEGSYLIEHL